MGDGCDYKGLHKEDFCDDGTCNQHGRPNSHKLYIPNYIDPKYMQLKIPVGTAKKKLAKLERGEGKTYTTSINF